MEGQDWCADSIREQRAMKIAFADYVSDLMRKLAARSRPSETLSSFNPPVRVPALPATRAYLRALRAAELASWNDARPIGVPTAEPLRGFER